ncbi:MAG TPA: prephenate dehydratase [Actinomycetes bacterium]|nr:prephenate dehydratase [Actinomycetes bacterium]
MSSPPPLPYGYLGPEGTFSEAALLGWLDSTDADAVSFTSVISALDAVRAGEIAGAMVPLENSVEGSVSATLDALATGSALTILAEAQVHVSFSLLARQGVQLSEVQNVTTHPHAEAQCRRWLAKHLPDAQFASAASTASAAASVADPNSHFDAAISAPLAGRVYGLQALADDIGDNPAETRFVLVGPPAAPQPASGADKTSLVLFMGEDHPGALLEILTEFAVRGVNLTRIESRPTGGGIGDYFFCVDIEGHIDDARVGEALMGLRRVCAEVRFLGSYPRVDGVTPTVRRGVADEEFRDAQAWLARIRDGRA